MIPDLNKIYVGDCIEVMKTWPENFIDTIITDPPYGIRFMGKAWDGADIEKTINSKRRHTPRDDSRGGQSTDNRAWAVGEYDRSLTANQAFQLWCTDWAAAALRIVKPGGTMLVFGGTRTFYRMTAGLEDAGWQIRDCLMWLYGSGFPKSHNLHGQFEGWGTALKPAWEPIIVAMKPLDGTFAQNAEKWGVAGLNVDGGRVGASGGGWNGLGSTHDESQWRLNNPDGMQRQSGRWPANLLLDEEASAMLDGVSGILTSGIFERRKSGSQFLAHANDAKAQVTGDSGGASRFFYVAKSGRSERNEGCDGIEEKPLNWSSGTKNPGSFQAEGTKKIASNNHPTVKPLDLMKYLCILTRTPTGGIVLDPFAGSGTTLWAAEFHNRPWIGIEMNVEYVAIAEARIANERKQLKMF